MSKRKPAAVSAVEFFQTAPIESAREVLAICVNTVKQRDGGAVKRGTVRTTRSAVAGNVATMAHDGAAEPVEA